MAKRLPNNKLLPRALIFWRRFFLTFLNSFLVRSSSSWKALISSNWSRVRMIFWPLGVFFSMASSFAFTVSNLVDKRVSSSANLSAASLSMAETLVKGREDLPLERI